MDEEKKFSRAQQIIMEQLGRPPAINPLAGDMISPGQINAGFMQALREGIEHEQYFTQLQGLVSLGYLELKGDSLMLTSLGAHILHKSNN